MTTITEARIREVIREEIAAADERSYSVLIGLLGEKFDRVPQALDLCCEVGVPLVGSADSASPLAVGVLAEGGDVVAERHDGSPSNGASGLESRDASTPIVGDASGAPVSPSGDAPGAIPGGSA